MRHPEATMVPWPITSSGGGAGTCMMLHNNVEFRKQSE